VAGGAKAPVRARSPRATSFGQPVVFDAAKVLQRLAGGIQDLDPIGAKCVRLFMASGKAIALNFTA
jgi:hypothetical protein